MRTRPKNAHFFATDNQSLKCILKYILDQFMIEKHHTITQFVTTTFLNNSLSENILSKVIRTRLHSPHTCLICGHNNSLKWSLKTHIGSVHENKTQKMLNLLPQLILITPPA